MLKIAPLKFLSILLLFFSEAYPRQFNINGYEKNELVNLIKSTINQEKYTADTIVKMLSTWNKFENIYKSGQDYIFYFDDPFFGKVPMRLHIPKSYKASTRNPFILLLHGSVQLSSFDRVKTSVSNPETDDDPFLKYLSNQGYIVLRPYADDKKKFNWVINRFRDLMGGAPIDGGVNLTYKTIINVIYILKHKLNIDDSRVYAFGHSDGADGAFCMTLFQPNLFAGAVIYNSFLTNLNANNIYLYNVANRPLYIVHSSLDDIRPLMQTKVIAEQLKKINNKIIFKEYAGYQHFDKHLSLDLPFVNKFMLQTKRDPFNSEIYWESNNSIDNQCDWLKVNKFNPSLPKAIWHDEINFKVYNKIDKTWHDHGTHYYNDPSYAIKGKFDSNSFTIETSRVREFEILISEKMVNLSKPVKVVVNGKIIYNKTVKASKGFIVKNFEDNFDRQAIWLNSIKLNAQ
jgi:predicted esterase